MTATSFARSAAGRRLPLSTRNRQDAGSNPARGIRAPVAQWKSSFGCQPTTAAISTSERRGMSYLTSYATRNPPVRGRNLDEQIPLNLPGFHADAYVRVFV